MSFKILCLATAVAVSISLPALSGSITVQEPYARASGESASSGAAFMVLKNHGETDDRLVSVTSEAAKKVALHTHSEGAIRLCHRTRQPPDDVRTLTSPRATT